MEGPQNRQEQLSGREKFEAILALFGTDTAREAFVALCREYIEARDRANLESYAPDVYVRRRAIISTPKQSVLHNRIMDAITRLASQAPVISPEQQAVLREMHDRDVTVKIIREYLAPATMPRDGEENGGGGKGKKNGMSDTAFFHSLGREH